VSTTERNKWVVLVLVCLAQFMVILDSTIVNVALPSIQEDLGFSQSNLAWVVNAYLIPFGGLLLLAGRLGDLLGQRRVFLVGLAIFTVASALCAASPDQGVLIGARFIQGIGGALSSAVIRSAAIAVAAASRMRRTRRNSSNVSSRWKSTMKLSASSSSRGSRLVTYVPSPRRTSRMLTRDSARTASRSELRDSPRSAARSASRGSRSPARSAPDVIMALIFSMASSVTAKPCLRRPVPPGEIRCLPRV